jgi:hypothetical protein
MRERPVRLLLGLKKDHYAIQDLLAEIVVDDGAVPALSQNLVNPPTTQLSLRLSLRPSLSGRLQFDVCGRPSQTDVCCMDWLL